MSHNLVNKQTGELEKIAGLFNSQKLNEISAAFPSTASSSNKLATMEDVSASESTEELIAHVETDDESASKAYEIGEQLILDGVLYTATASILIGDALVAGTNITSSDNITTQIRNSKSGGHEIQDSVGTTFPKRTNLVFENAVVADDETNDATIVTPKGLDLELGDVSGATATQDFDDVTLTWSDPSDVVIGGSTLIRWAGTAVVRKKGSAPQSVNDGTLIVENTTRDQYASTGYRDEGLDFGDTYYYRFFPYRMSGTTKVHTVGTAVSVVIEKTALTVPSQSGTLTYDGTVKTPTWANYDSTQITIGGDEDGTNAGTYTATFTPKTGYKWSDDTDTAKNVDWVIGKATLSAPAVTDTSLTYDGTAQGPTIASYDSTKIAVTGDTATNAGSYTLEFSLVDSTNYQFGVGDITSVAWTIAKANGGATFTLGGAAFDPGTDTIVIDPDALTVTLSIASSTGTVSGVTSSDTSIATVALSGNNITFSNVNETSGTTTATVTVDASANYNAANISIDVSCEFAPASLEDATWAQVKTYGNAGTGATVFAVGDTKTVALNGTVGTLALNNYQCKVFIIDFNYRGDNGIYFQGFKSTAATPVDIALCDSYLDQNKTDGTKAYNMEHWGYNNYGGWKGCDIRYDVLGSTETAPSGYGSQASSGRTGYDATSAAKTSPVSNTLMAALPSDLRNVLAAWTIYTDNVGGGTDTASNVSTSVDYLPLLAEYEVHGARSYANSYENTGDKQKQMAYYTNGNSKIKYNHSNTGTAIRWWVRSPDYTNGNLFCNVHDYGNAYYGNSYYSRGLAPAFKVA